MNSILCWQVTSHRSQNEVEHSTVSLSGAYMWSIPSQQHLNKYDDEIIKADSVGLEENAKPCVLDTFYTTGNAKHSATEM